MSKFYFLPMKFRRVFVIFLSFSVVPSALSQLPQNAIDAFEKLPHHELNLDFIVAKALQSSDSLQAIKAMGWAVDNDRLLALETLTTQLSLSGTKSRDETQSRSFFEPKEMTTYSFGISKYLSTGTRLGLEFVDSQSILDDLNTFQFANSTNLKFKMTQNLWRDRWGILTRNQITSGELASQANRLQLNENIQSWILELIKTYYGAWLMKKRVVAAGLSLKRRDRLVAVTKTKLRRGTAERPDLLQIESARILSEIEYQKSSNDLQSLWRELVANLKLPQSWLEISAREIPLAIDVPYSEALEVCDSRFKILKSEKSDTENAESDSLEKKIADLRLKVSRRRLESARASLRPDLLLQGEMGGAGALGSFSKRTRESVDLGSPEWAVGLQFRMPLEWYREKAGLAQALAQEKHDLAIREKASADQETEWLNGCAGLKILHQNREAHRQAAELLSERLLLEERQFELGRASATEVIMAGDDFSQAEVQLNQITVNLNVAAWEILKRGNKLESRLEVAMRDIGENVD